MEIIAETRKELTPEMLEGYIGSRLLCLVEREGLRVYRNLGAIRMTGGKIFLYREHIGVHGEILKEEVPLTSLGNEKEGRYAAVTPAENGE